MDEDRPESNLSHDESVDIGDAEDVPTALSVTPRAKRMRQDLSHCSGEEEDEDKEDEENEDEEEEDEDEEEKDEEEVAEEDEDDEEEDCDCGCNG